MKLASCSGQGRTQACMVRKACLRNWLHDRRGAPGRGDRPVMEARPFGRWGCLYYLSTDEAREAALDEVPDEARLPAE